MSQRILYIEDNEDNVFMLGRRLQRRGYTCDSAPDGAQGLTRARESLPDLILMDLELPELDGWEATRRLKADPATCHIPIVVLTAHAFAGHRQRAIEAGADAFHTKPVDFPALLATLARLLGRGGT